MKQFYINNPAKVLGVLLISLLCQSAANGKEPFAEGMDAKERSLRQMPAAPLSIAQTEEITGEAGYAAVPVRAEENGTQWTEWEFYGNMQSGFPSESFFTGSWDYSNDSNELEVYARRQLADPSKWQVRIDNVYGSASLLLDYNYTDKRFVLSDRAVTNLAVPQAWKDAMGENFEICDNIEIRQFPNSERPFLYNLYSVFFPESLYCHFNQLCFIGGYGKPGTDFEKYVYCAKKSVDCSPQTSSYELYGYSPQYMSSKEDKHYVYMDLGESVSNVRFVCIPEEYQYCTLEGDIFTRNWSPDIPGTILNDCKIVQAGSDDYISCELPIKRRGRFVVISMAMNADGEIINIGNPFFVCSNVRDERAWTSVGKGTLQDRTLFKYWDGDNFNWDDFYNSDYTVKGENPEWEVDVEECLDSPGLFRIRNPYANHPDWKNIIFANRYDPHMFPGAGDEFAIYINASDPDHVLIEPSFDGIGFASLFGPLRLEFLYYMERTSDGFSTGYDPDRYSGRLEEDKIVFPLFSISRGSGWREEPWSYDDIYENAGDFSRPDIVVKLPAGAGLDYVGDESNEAALPVEYYNLQGMRISSPVNGQVCIFKQGSNIRKVRY